MTAGNKLILEFNGGHGTFLGNPSIDISCGRRVVTGQLNDDGNLDLGVGDPCEGVLWILLGLGDGTFAPPVGYTGARNAGSFTDFDGDGDLDAVVPSAIGNGISILANNGDGTFDIPINLPVSHSVDNVLVGDLNVDGKLDLLAAGFNNHSTLFGIGDGTYSDPQTFKTQGLTTSTLTDLNSDGAPDFAGSRFTNGTIVAVVLLNLSNGTFGEEVVYGDDSFDGDGETSVAGGVEFGIASGDITGDGQPDIFVTSGGREFIILYTNQGDGIFDNGARYQSGSNTTGTALVDLDNDGDMDAVVGSRGGSSIMLNRRVPADCNSNGVLDDLDVFTGTSSDCNDNGVPDACDADCDNSGTPDDCDVADGLVDDCNNNGLPDSCERDCDANGIPDECDIVNGTAIDCNANGNLDSCDLADGTSIDCNNNGIPDECDLDCNNNDVPDECDIDSGFSIDDDMNGIPDECEIP